jgi:hypothetical protein
MAPAWLLYFTAEREPVLWAAAIPANLFAHPVLRFPASGVTVAGFVELREESQHTDRQRRDLSSK